MMEVGQPKVFCSMVQVLRSHSSNAPQHVHTLHCDSDSMLDAVCTTEVLLQDWGESNSYQQHIRANSRQGVIRGRVSPRRRLENE